MLKKMMKKIEKAGFEITGRSRRGFQVAGYIDVLQYCWHEQSSEQVKVC